MMEYNIKRKYLIIASIVMGIFIIISGVSIIFADPAVPNPGHSWSEIECIGCINNTNVADNAISTTKIENNAVTNTKIGPDAVTGAKVLDDTLNSSDIISLNWVKLQNYPAGCPMGQFVTTINDTLTCDTPSGPGGGITGGGSATYLALWNSTSSINSSVVYQNGSNIGIGTTSTGAKLHVFNGNLIVDSASTGAGESIFRNGSSYFMISNIDRAGSAGYSSIGSYRTSEGWKNLIINSGGGNVGIGTTNPSSTLEVNGNVELTNLYDTDASNFFDGACGAGNYVTDISSTGALTCTAETGDISAVNAGYGLNGGGTSGSVTLNATAGIGIIVNSTGINVNTSFVQGRVTGSCVAGSSIRVINENGSVSCENDDVGGGGYWTRIADGARYLLHPSTLSDGINIGTAETGWGTSIHIDQDSGYTPVMIEGKDNEFKDIIWRVTNGTTYRWKWGMSPGTPTAGGEDSRFSVWFYNSNGSLQWDEWLTMEKGGNVGIGVQNPTDKLMVYGNIRATGTGDICTATKCLNSVGGGSGGTINFPEGYDGTAINAQINSATGYTVPSGQVLYITSAYNNITSVNYLRLNGSLYYYNVSARSNANFPGPLMVTTGTTITANSNSIWITGILINNNPAIITVKDISLTTTAYTVPSGKTLYIQTMYNENSTANPLVVGATGFNVYWNLTGYTGYSFGSPLVFPAGSNIKAGGSVIRISGYEK